MRDLGALLPEALKRRNPGPWIWLYRIELETTTVSRPTAFLTSHHESVQFGSPLRTYHPYPIRHTISKQDSEGNLPTVNLVLANPGRQLTRFLEVSKGASGQPVVISLVHKNTLADPLAKVEQTFEIRGSVADERSITIRLGPADFYDMPMPHALYIRNRCRHLYKSAQCGYKGTIATCDKSLDGANGCNVHGADEIATGAPVRHPANFGGFPAIPRAVR